MEELKACSLDEARKVLWYCAQFTDDSHWSKQYRKALTDICDELDRRAAPENPQAPDLLETVKADLSYILRDINERDKIFLYVKNAQFALSQYERRAAPENKALTVKQLRQMRGDSVWVAMMGEAKPPICEIVVECYEDGAKMVNSECPDDYGAFDLYGKTWLAYARRPEGSENDA